MTSNLQAFVDVQNANVINLVSDIMRYIPKRPRIEKFDMVWEQTKRGLSVGNKKVYTTFINAHLCGISHVRKYLTEVSPYNKYRPKEGETVLFGYGHATKCSRYLTEALLVFLENYYGKIKVKKILQYELWRA